MKLEEKNLLKINHILQKNLLFFFQKYWLKKQFYLSCIWDKKVIYQNSKSTIHLA